MTSDDPRRLGDPGTPAFRLEYYPFYLLNRAASRYNAVIERALRPLDIDIPTWRVLMILGEEAPRSIGQIAENAVINISTMTRIIQRMTQAELVSCEPRPDDNRVTEVFLTAKGEQKLAACRRAVAPVYAALIKGFSRPQFEAMIATLHQFYRNLSHFHPE